MGIPVAEIEPKYVALVKRIEDLFLRLPPETINILLSNLNNQYGYNPGNPRIIRCSVCGTPIPGDITSDKDGTYWCSWCDQAGANPSC